MIEIGVGGFLGAVARYLVYVGFEKRSRQKKWATFTVNSIGSFLIGLSAGSASSFYITGFLGAFTTFSTFALDAVEEAENGKKRTALLYLTGTLFAGIVLFICGYSAAN